jgi:hypothetical protein
MDRCCDFEAQEAEESTAFDVMSEKFTEEQTQRRDGVNLYKYTHWSNKVGPVKPKEETEEDEKEL